MDTGTADHDPLIECADLCKDFHVQKQTIRVLERVHLSVDRGETVVITGKTGSGKSTLLGLLGGLDRPTSGQIILEGRRVENLSNPQWSAIRRRKIGIIFQNFNLLPSWRAVENVEAAMLHTGMARSARRERAKALLAAVGLGDRLEHLPSELSVGEQQSVSLARAFANDPLLILADEPTGDVDPETAGELVKRLTAPARTRGTTLIVATHGTFPLDVADRVFVLKNGSLAPI